MADIDLKAATPDTTLPTTGFLFGADSQAASAPSVFTTQAVATTLLGSTTLSGATITASQPVLDLSQTWNASGVTFTGLRFNADTGSNANSAAGSLLMDLQLEGSSKFKVSKAGDATAENVTARRFKNTDNTVNLNGQDGFLSGNSSFQVSWTSSSSSEGTRDTFLTRRGPANLRLGAADAAGSAISISSVASNQLTLASAHGLTTGAAVIITGTAAPSGTTLNVRYYARVIAASVIELYSTYDQATAASGTSGIIAVTTAGTSASVRLATPFQSFGVQDFTGTDIPGQPFIIRGSRGTGTGAGGDIIFQVAPAGTTGSSQNTLVTALYIRSDGAVLTNTINSNGNYYLGLQGGITGGGYWASGTDGALGASGGGLVVAANRDFCWSNTAFNPTAAVDLRLARDAANTLALRNGANAQTFNVYNTYTSSTNFERFRIVAQSAAAVLIGTEKGSGGGTARALELQTDGVTRLTIASSGPVTVSHIAGLVISNTGGNGFSTTGGGYIIFKSSGVLTLTDASDADFGRLQFGGTTSSFPALKRSSTTLQARLADDSAFAGFASANMQAATAYTVATLPGTPGTGMIARVTDALAPTIGMTVTGGGAAYALVNYNGANWTVIGI